MAITRGKADYADATPTARKRQQSKRVRSESPDNAPDAIETKRSKIIEALDNAFSSAQDALIPGDQDSEENDSVSSATSEIGNTGDAGMQGDGISNQVDEDKTVSGSPDHVFADVVGCVVRTIHTVRS